MKINLLKFLGMRLGETDGLTLVPHNGLGPRLVMLLLRVSGWRRVQTRGRVLYVDMTNPDSLHKALTECEPAPDQELH